VDYGRVQMQKDTQSSAARSRARNTAANAL